MLGLRLRKVLNFLTFLALFFCVIIFSDGAPAENVLPFLGAVGIAPATLLISAIRSRLRGIALVYEQTSREHRGYEVVETYQGRIETDGEAATTRLIWSALACAVVITALGVAAWASIAQDRLARVAQAGSTGAERLAAIEKLSDEGVLAQIAERTQHNDARKAVAGRLKALGWDCTETPELRLGDRRSRNVVMSCQKKQGADTRIIRYETPPVGP